ncbi:hypothetical protein LPJ56_003812, partial [Coemansia sp. RSA 2599]
MVVLQADKQGNALAKTIIRSMLSGDLFCKVVRPSAYEMWSILETMFETKTVGSLITDLKELLSFQQGENENPIDYWIQATNKWAKFVYKDINFSVLSVVMPLWGLSSKYSSIRERFGNVDPNCLNSDEILTAIKLAHSSDIGIQSFGIKKEPSFFGAASVESCSACGGKGHSFHECPSYKKQHAASSKGQARRVQLGGVSVFAGPSISRESQLFNNPNAWMLDSGAMMSTTPHSDSFVDYKHCS